MMLNQKIRFRNFYRTALYLPVIVPIVVSAFIWQRAFHPDFGIINEFLGWFRLRAKSLAFLSASSPNRPLSSCVCGVWAR